MLEDCNFKASLNNDKQDDKPSFRLSRKKLKRGQRLINCHEKQNPHHDLIQSGYLVSQPPVSQLKNDQCNNSDSFADFEIAAQDRNKHTQALSANFLLGFSYHEDQTAQVQSSAFSKHKYIQNHDRRESFQLSKVYSSFQFLLREDKDYLLNLYDPNKEVEWKDVFQVNFRMPNAEDIKCPICMEDLSQMQAPRITKCGHILCWSCVLQYLAFEKEKSWKKCPLCNENILKHELRNVQIKQSRNYQEGEVIKLNLMARSKDSIIVKDLYLESLKKGTSCYQRINSLKLPNVDNEVYEQTRLLLTNQDFMKNVLENDLEILKIEKKLHQSSQEFEKIPFIEEAIDHCKKELYMIEKSKEQYEDQLLSFEDHKNLHNLQQEMRQKHLTDPQMQNTKDLLYFYQSSSGDNLYLHPLCFKILQHQHNTNPQSNPVHLEAPILELNHFLVDNHNYLDLQKKDPYLNHLPDGDSFAFVEVDLRNVVDKEIYREYEKQIMDRERQRQLRSLREERYAGMVEKLQKEKFEQIKREAFQSMLTNRQDLTPGCVKNMYQSSPGSESTLQSSQFSSNGFEEEKCEPCNILQPQSSSETLIWNNLEDLLTMDNQKYKSQRQTTFQDQDPTPVFLKSVESFSTVNVIDVSEFPSISDIENNQNLDISKAFVKIDNKPYRKRKRRL